MEWEATRAASVLVLAVVLVGCGNLSKSKAEELLAGSDGPYASGKAATCTAKFYSRAEAKGGDLTVKEGGDCVRTLAATKAVPTEKCMSWRPGDLSSMRTVDDAGSCVTFKTGSGATVKGNQITFPCGKFEFLGVESITTDGRKAKVKFRRRFTAADFMQKIVDECEASVLTKPSGDEKGLDSITWTASKDDSGNWSFDD